MSQVQISLSTVRNYGFFINPNMQDSQLKAQTHREQFWQGAYCFANSDRDQECKDKYNDIFGKESIPYDDENAAYFLGRAALHQQGFTGSPFQYFLQNRMELPAEVTDEETARIYIGNDIIKKMRAAYDKETEYKKKVATVQNELPKHLAHLVATGAFDNTEDAKKSMDVLNEIGMWDKLEPSINRARAAWASVSHDARTVNGLQDIAKRENLAFVADLLSDENGKLDEAAAMAFFSTVMNAAEKLQSKGTSFASSTGAAIQTTAEELEEFADRAIDNIIKDELADKTPIEVARDAASHPLDISHTVPKLIKTAAQIIAPEEYNKRKNLYNDPRIELLRGYMQSAIHSALSPSEQAGTYAKIASETGRLLGGSIIPMAGALAATYYTRGRGVGLIGQAAAGWAGGLAVSKDSLINQAVAQAYVEGVDNPEEYGYYAGLGQAAAENIAGVGTSGLLLFKGINRFMTKAAAKATTSKFLSNAYARATLAWAATTGIEGSLELSEEEMGAWLGSQFNALARATGTEMSEQNYTFLETISQMKPHQIASMYVFAGALGLGGAAANFAAAQEMSIDIGKLKAVGYSDEKAREVQAHGIVTARKIEEVSNSNATAEEKEAQITAIQDERLEYLGKTFREDVANASNEELVKRSKEENAEFTYRSLLAWAIQNGLDEQALINAGYISGKKQADKNYLVSYNEKDEKGNVKLVTKEWNRDQLHGFMTFLRGTDAHMQLRELAGQLMAMQFAEKVASVEELKIKLANLRDTPITELATIMQHEAITPELFEAFAEKEVANIEADMRDKGMTWTEAEMEKSKLLPGVTRKDVIQAAKAAEERKQNAIAKGEIKPGQSVEYPGLNISRFDGTTLVAFFNQKITLSQMLEEMMEARLNQQAKNDPELYNKLGTILQGIQNKLKGVQILPKGKTSFSRGDIVEAYSHLAVAEVIANPAYTSHLSQREQAVVQDVLGSVFRAQRYKAIAGAWLNYKESAEGKAYLENGGKDLVDIFSEAGFTFGKHLEAKQATEEQKIKALEARNFLPDFNAETKLLENKAEAEQKLAEVNAKEAQEPTVIPANESVTGEEIVITPEQKAAEQAPDVARPDIVQFVKEKEQLEKTADILQKEIRESYQKIRDYRSEHVNASERAQKLEKLYKNTEWESEEEKTQRKNKIKSLKKSAKSYLTELQLEEKRVKELDEKLFDINARLRELTDVESTMLLQTAAAKARDFALYLSNFVESEKPAKAIEFGLYTITQNGEPNPAYVQGLLISKFLHKEEIETFTDEELQETIKHAMVDEAIFETVGQYTTAERTKENVSYKKKQLKDAQIEEKLIREKAERVVASLSGNTGALPKAPQWTGISEARYNKQTDEERATGIVKALKTTASKDPTRKVINHVYHQVKDGKEYWVSTDGARLTVLSRDTNAPDTENFYEAKTGKEVASNEAGGKYVNFAQVIPNKILHKAEIDFAPYRALKSYKKVDGKLDISGTKDPRVIYKPTLEGRNYKPIKLNTVLFRDAVDQLASLARVLNFNSEVTVGYVREDAPLVFTAQQNGWEWKHIIMQQSRTDETLPGDISLSNKPQFIGATQYNEQQREKAVAELKQAEVKTAELKTQVKEMEARYKIVSELEKNLSEEEKHARWFAAKLGHYPRAFHRTRVKEIINKNLSDTLMEVLTYSHTQNKWTSALFTRITGIKLPGTIKGNEAVIKEWAPKEYAEYIKRQETSPDSSTSDANFSIQEAADKGMFQDGVLHTDNAIVTEPNFSIQAMHASPHEFYKFDTAFMGTGTGGQWYGWGLYFTSGEAAARKYFEGFKRKKNVNPVAYQVELNINDKYLIDWAGAVDKSVIEKIISDNTEMPDFVKRNIRNSLTGAEVYRYIQKWQERLVDNLDEAPKAASLLLLKSGIKGIRHQDNKSWLGDNMYGDDHYTIFSGDDIKITAINKSGKWSMTEGWEEYNDPTANFSIQAASLPDRFAGHPLAERMSNFMRTEARRYERTLSKQTPEDAATNALFATQSIIHAVDKYVRNGEFKLPRESMVRLKHARALIDKYAQMMKSGKVRSFSKIDKAEQAELLAAMAEAAAGIDADAINAMTPEEYAALKAEVEAEMMPELYRKHARALADDVAKSNLPKKEKIRTLSALHRIIKEGKLAKNTTLDKPEQRQLTELVENEAQDAIEKEARNREFKLTSDKIQQDAKERNERMVRVAATGRIGELLRDMLNETADIVDLYLKTELLKKLKRITDSVKIKRSPSKTLKGKMGAAEYRRMDAIVELMEMSARAKDNALGEIENARRILNESKGEIPEVAVGSLLWEIINSLNEQGVTVSVDTLNIELNNREADINVFANLDGMNYAEALNAARGLAGLIYFGRTAWQMKQAAEYERIKAFLDYFYEHTDSELGTSQAIEKGKKKKLGNIFNSSMNDAQLLFALAGHEGLRPVMDEMRQKLAMAQDARNLHIKSITNQIYATYARLIGMRPQTEAGYTDKQLREASNKFSMEFEKWNETDKPKVVREWIDNDGELKKQEMELSRLQALDLILTYRQQHYQPNADKHGYTEAVLNKLEEYCGTRLMAMGEAFKRTIQNDGTAQVYEERTGIPMYKDPSYWPGSININTINLTSEEPLVNPYNPAGTYNRLKQRVKNTNEAKYQNAFEKWKHAIAEGANYIYLHPITNTLNRMLAHREFANRLHGLIGPDLFSQLRLMLNVLDSSTWQETALRDEANNWAASMLKATAPAVLALNPGTMARQLSAINNYAMLPGIRISRLPALIALIKQDKSAIKLSDIMQLDSFRARYRDNAEVNDMLGLGANAKFSTYNKWAKEGMNIIDRLDIWSNAVSACLYYNMLYEQMQEKNQGAANPLSEEEIRNICEQNVAQLLRLVAQPLEKANKSAMYWKYGNTWMGSIFLYMSTEMVNKTGMLRATYIKNKAEGMPFYKNAWQLIYKMGLGLGGMTFLIEVGLFLLFSGDLPDDEKEWLAALFSLAIYSAFGQYLSRIPFIGSVTDYYLSPYGQYATSKSQQQNPALSIDKTSAKLLKMMSDNKHYSASEWQVAYTRFVRDLTAVSGVASGLVPQAQWISTTTATLQSLSAAMNTVYPVARSVQMDSWMRNITPDWYKPKKTKKRTKSALEEALTPEPEKKKGKKSK